LSALLDPLGTASQEEGLRMLQNSTEAADTGGIYVFHLVQQFQRNQGLGESWSFQCDQEKTFLDGTKLLFLGRHVARANYSPSSEPAP